MKEEHLWEYFTSNDSGRIDISKIDLEGVSFDTVEDDRKAQKNPPRCST